MSGSDRRGAICPVHSCPVDRSDAAWLRERLPQAEILVWPVGHHFPHLAHPARLAAGLVGLAAGRANLRPPNAQAISPPGERP